MAKIGYARVSTRGQNDDSQVDDLTAYGCEKIFTDTASGKHAARPELDKALAYLRPGDVFVITGGRPSKNSFATAWRCRGMRQLGPLRRWPVRVVGGWGLCRGRAMAGRSGRCIVVLACRSSSPVWLGPFEAVSKSGAGAPCRVTPVAAACACVSLLY
jgi:hypothetical protein